MIAINRSVAQYEHESSTLFSLASGIFGRLHSCWDFFQVNSTCGGDVDTKACIEASAEVEKHNRVCGFKPQLVNTDRYIDAVQAP